MKKTPLQSCIEFLDKEFPDEKFIVLHVTEDGKYYQAEVKSNIKETKTIVDALGFAHLTLKNGKMSADYN